MDMTEFSQNNKNNHHHHYHHHLQPQQNKVNVGEKQVGWNSLKLWLPEQ
jgi:hypothetical protein